MNLFKCLWLCSNRICVPDVGLQKQCAGWSLKVVSDNSAEYIGGESAFLDNFVIKK